MYSRRAGRGQSGRPGPATRASPLFATLSVPSPAISTASCQWQKFQADAEEEEPKYTKRIIKRGRLHGCPVVPRGPATRPPLCLNLFSPSLSDAGDKSIATKKGDMVAVLYTGKLEGALRRGPARVLLAPCPACSQPHPVHPHPGAGQTEPFSTRTSRARRAGKSKARSRLVCVVSVFRFARWPLPSPLSPVHITHHRRPAVLRRRQAAGAALQGRQRARHPRLGPCPAHHVQRRARRASD